MFHFGNALQITIPVPKTGFRETSPKLEASRWGGLFDQNV
jgi:hypothetical protein